MRNGIGLRVLLGGLMIAGGIAVLLGDKMRLPLGRLPGDFAYRGRNFGVFFPLTSSIVVSLLVTLLLYLLARFRR